MSEFDFADYRNDDINDGDYTGNDGVDDDGVDDDGGNNDDVGNDDDDDDDCGGGNIRVQDETAGDGDLNKIVSGRTRSHKNYNEIHA